MLLQDFTGVPAIVDLAAMRDAMADLGGDPGQINPLQPVELVVDHSVQVDAFASTDAFAINQQLDYSRNRERYALLRWAQRAFANVGVVPPNTGIVHQVNLEYLARVVFVSPETKGPGLSALRRAYPDTLVGTDSHTPMVNGIGVLGWGVGGIEAEAAMLGQAVSMLIPDVIGVRVSGALPDGATATDLVLTVTEMLRRHGVVGKFVEFFGPGVASLTVADRATIGNMSPEYGSTCTIFPVDQGTLDYLRFSGRTEERVAMVEAYMKDQGLFHSASSPEPDFATVLKLDLGMIEPSVAGPRRPQDRVPLRDLKQSFARTLPSLRPLPPASTQKEAAVGDSHGAGAVGVWGEGGQESPAAHEVMAPAPADVLDHGSVVIAAITSCTNTSNPSVMLAAGLLAKKAVERGLKRKPWVKTSLAPGSKVVTDYYRSSGLQPFLDALGFNLVGLRLHHLHRELGAASRGDRGRDPPREPRGLRGPLRQPQLRGAHQLRRPRQLPDVSAAGGRLCAHRAHRRGPGQRSPRHRQRRPPRVPARDLAPPGRDRGSPQPLRPVGDVPEELRGRLRRRRVLAGARGSGGRPVRVGPRFHLRAAAPVLRRHVAPAPGARARTSPASGSSPSSGTASPPTTSRRRAASRRTRRRGST